MKNNKIMLLKIYIQDCERNVTRLVRYEWSQSITSLPVMSISLFMLGTVVDTRQYVDSM